MSNFYKINVIKVSQLNSGTGGIFTGRITFKELLKIHRLTERKESTFDPYGEKNVDYSQLDDDEFQRHLSPKKLNDIRSYLKTEFESKNIQALFPSSVIISLDLNENNDEKINLQSVENYYSENLNSCFIRANTECGEDSYQIFIPKNKRICLIVDGQHRFYGLRKYYEGLSQDDKADIENFEFICTMLLGFDPYQVAEVFANVNFHQKPVNRSLYYDIFGSSSKDRNEIQLAHFLVLHLQNNEKSPLKDMIKLLGKGYGLFSQAFLVEKLMIHFNENAVWEDLYKDYLNGGKTFLRISDFIKAYFSSVEFNYNNCWPERVDRDGQMVYSAYSYNFILCKTTGMGALLRLMKDVYKTMERAEPEQWRSKIDLIFSKIPKNEAKELFSKEGDFGGGGSEGLQLKLYRHLKDRLGLQ